MITSILDEAYSCDILLWLEDQNTLKYKSSAGSLSTELLQKIREYKPMLVTRLLQNKTMQKAGWLTYQWGEAYSKTISPTSIVFMFRESENIFCVWRGTWKHGQSKPISEKSIINDVNFTQAFEKAESYHSFLIGKRKAR